MTTTERRPLGPTGVEIAPLVLGAMNFGDPTPPDESVAILEDGNERLGAYVAHQMTKAATPEGQVRRWVEGVMSQADDDIAATTRAVMWNAGGPLAGVPAAAIDPVARPLVAPLAALGSTDPELDAALVVPAMFGRLRVHLFAGTQPGPTEIDHLVGFCLGVARAGAAGVDTAPGAGEE